VLTVVAAVVAGVLVAVQSKINAELAGQVDGSVTAAWISFAVGLIVVGTVALVVSPVRKAVARIPQVLRSRELLWWQFLGGAAGAWLVTTQGIVVPVVGVTLFMVSVVAGQVVGSLLVDRLGMSPAGELPISAVRGFAALLAAAAVIATAWPRLTDDSAVSWILLIAGLAGAGTAVQQAINSSVAVGTGQPFAATTVNFVVGLVALTLVLGGQAVLTGLPEGSLPSEPWLYLGGPIGVLFIALAAWAVRPLGVLAFALLAIAGQLLGAVGIDVAIPTGPGLSLSTFVGLALVGMAVVLASRSRSRG
jgi:transporter family-2 protein